jgi:hypothetical protein
VRAYAVIANHFLVLFRQEVEHLRHEPVDVHGEGFIALFRCADIELALVAESRGLLRVINGSNLAVVKITCGKVFRGRKSTWLSVPSKAYPHRARQEAERVGCGRGLAGCRSAGRMHMLDQ